MFEIEFQKCKEIYVELIKIEFQIVISSGVFRCFDTHVLLGEMEVKLWQRTMRKWRWT